MTGWESLGAAGDVKAKFDEADDDAKPATVEVANLKLKTTTDVADATDAAEAKSLFGDAKVDIGVSGDSKLYSETANYSITRRPTNSITGKDKTYQVDGNDIHYGYDVSSTSGALSSMSSKRSSQSNAKQRLLNKLPLNPS